MSELTLLVLQLGFLLLLWVFIFAIVYALRSDLFGQRVRKLQTESPASAPAPGGLGVPELAGRRGRGGAHGPRRRRRSRHPGPTANSRRARTPPVS